jgi:hypothetical protein
MTGTVRAQARTYLYNPSLWILALILLSTLEYTTRCGDALR